MMQVRSYSSTTYVFFSNKLRKWRHKFDLRLERKVSANIEDLHIFLSRKQFCVIQATSRHRTDRTTESPRSALNRLEPRVLHWKTAVVQRQQRTCSQTFMTPSTLITKQFMLTGLRGRERFEPATKYWRGNMTVSHLWLKKMLYSSTRRSIRRPVSCRTR